MLTNTKPWSNPTMLVLSVFCCLTVCLIVAACWRLRKTLTPAVASSEIFLVEESGLNRIQFYRPMERLLAADDFQFLSQQPGFNSQVLRRMRADRRRIFRQYLGSLSVDFSDLTNRLRTIMVESPHSREDLAATILTARVLFTATLVVIEGRLLLHACGLYQIRISALNLVAGLTQMQRELEQFTLTPAMSPS